MRLSLCKSGLGAAYWTRVRRMECRRLKLERGILKMHVRWLHPTLARFGSRKLNQEYLFKVELKHAGVCHPCFEPLNFPKLK